MPSDFYHPAEYDVRKKRKKVLGRTSVQFRFISIKKSAEDQRFFLWRRERDSFASDFKTSTLTISIN